MKCYKCGKPARIRVPSLNKPICDSCFAHLIEKKFNKRLRELKITKATIKLEKPSDEVLQYLVKKKGLPSGKLIPQHTLDDLAISILKSFNHGKDLMIKEESPLDSITEWELIEYARIKKLGFKGNPREGEEARLHELLLKLDERRSGVMYSLKAFMKNLE